MFSKEESKKLREEFWISFGKSFPRKWILYDTKVKGLVLKFHFDTLHAMVVLDVELDDLKDRIALWEKLISLKSILHEAYLPDARFEDTYILGNYKEISRILVQKSHVSIHNKNTWQETMVFLKTNMQKLEGFFLDYEEILRD